MGKELSVWEDSDGANDEGLIWLRMRSVLQICLFGGIAGGDLVWDR